MNNNNNIPCVKFSPCGIYLANVSIDKTLRIFSVRSGEQMHKIQLPDWGWAIQWVTKEHLNPHQQLV